MRGLRSLLYAMALLLPPGAQAAAADEREFEFNSVFLQGATKVDVSRFARGNPVLPGDYLVDLQVNGKWLQRMTVRFIGSPGSDMARPCIDRPIFDRIGIDLEQLTQQARMQLPATGSGRCVELEELIPDASVSFELSNLRLDIGIPQAAMLRAPRDYVSPAYWDKGVPSISMGYNLHAYRSTAGDRRMTQGHVDLQTGVNYSSWHLRQRSALDVADGGSTRYKSVAAYLTHDIPALRGNLTIGESFTDGAVLDAFAFRGVALASSDQMLPDSQRDFAPVVRGIARTNARVVITQNGVTILETTVSPGPFEISDLYATGYGGDLSVTIQEADGSRQAFSVPYSAMAQLIRAGVWRYAATAGSLSQPSSTGTETFIQGTLQHGFSSLLTGFGGAIGAEHYRAVSLGIALNTRAGALSAAVTRTRSSVDSAQPARAGQGLRLSYSKVVRRTHTDITLAAYPFLSQGYYSLAEAVSARQGIREGVSDLAPRTRRQWQLSINQNLPGAWGDLFLSASTHDRWHTDNSVTQLQAGYTNQLRIRRTRLSYGVVIAQQEDMFSGERDRRVQVNFSLPVANGAHAPTLATRFVRETRRGRHINGSQQVLIGSLGDHHQLSYSLAGSQTAGDSAYTANGQYRGTRSSVSASISRGSTYSQQSLGATGGLVIHGGGVTLANQMTDTFGIVEAKGAEGARVTNSVGTAIDRSGYAIIPFLLPYRMNTVNIDPAGAVSPDVEFQSTSALVAPRLNSVVLIRFTTVEGRAILITARTAQGMEVPFGATVLDTQGSEVGLVGQNGRIYLRGIAESGTLTARWGDEADEKCAFRYELPASHKTGDPFVRLDAECRASGPEARLP